MSDEPIDDSLPFQVDDNDDDSDVRDNIDLNNADMFLSNEPAVDESVVVVVQNPPKQPPTKKVRGVAYSPVEDFMICKAFIAA
jgi:hypothetical protein